MNKRGFTLIEIVIVLFVFSTALIVVVQSLTRSTSYISEMTQKTIALNLAKEGIESVYNIRNTNWKRRSSQKNKCRLASDPMTETTTCSSPLLSPGKRVVLDEGNSRKMVLVNSSIGLEEPIPFKISDLSNDYLLHYLPSK